MEHECTRFSLDLAIGGQKRLRSFDWSLIFLGNVRLAIYFGHSRMEEHELERSESTIIGLSISHYRVVSQLGDGAMDAVNEAEDFKVHNRVALN
jgi:hypothetical protein